MYLKQCMCITGLWNPGMFGVGRDLSCMQTWLCCCLAVGCSSGGALPWTWPVSLQVHRLIRRLGSKTQLLDFVL